MCFVNDGDWHAAVYEVNDGPATKDDRCADCYQPIKVGDPVRYFFMQEYEECQTCYDDPEEPEYADCTHNYGERFEARICATCLKFRAAIKVVEVAEGCREDESEPAIGELPDVLDRDMNEYDHVSEYKAKALEMYPELAGHPWLIDINPTPELTHGT